MPILDTYHTESNSEEMQEIIGHVPHWIIRWGISVIMAIFFIILTVTNIVKYPDVITASLIIHAKEQPLKMTWYITDPTITYHSKIIDGQQVKVGDTLIVERNLRTKAENHYTSSIVGKAYVLKGIENNPRANMMLIAPPISNYEVQLRLPIQGAGLVFKNQRVLLRLDEFPADEFGFLEGYVTNIIPISVDNHYRANVCLTNGLSTNMGKRIPMQPLMQGKAEVILDSRSLFSRVFNSFI